MSEPIDATDQPFLAAPPVVILLIERHRAMSGNDVLRSIRSLPEVVSCDVAEGPFDLMLRIQAANDDRLKEIAAFFDRQLGVDSVRVVVPPAAISSA